MYAIGRVIARVTGADLRSYLLPRLFEPLDVPNPAWHTCPLGYPFAESDLFLHTSELARFAQLLLQTGEWGGQQLVPASYVRRMTAERVDTKATSSAYAYGYGLGVWIDRDDTFRMDGRYGQYVVISPRRRAAVTVTVTAHSERDDELLAAIHDLIVDRLG